MEVWVGIPMAWLNEFFPIALIPGISINVLVIDY